MSLRRNTSEWIEVQRLPNVIEKTRYPLIAVCDSHVLLGREEGDGTLYVYNVNEHHNVSAAGSVHFSQQNLERIACTRIINDTYVALTRHNKTQVTMNRLVWPLTPSYEDLDVITGKYSRRLLFRGDLLLVADWNSTTNSHAIVSLRSSGGALSEKRVLFDATLEDRIEVCAWALAGDRLVLWDYFSRDLLIYAFA